MQEEFSPFGIDQNITDFDDLKKNENEVTSVQKKMASVKMKLDVNKMKTRIEGYDALSSSVSDSVTKSPLSGEKKEKKEKTMKDHWSLFKRKFFLSEKIKKFRKKV